MTRLLVIATFMSVGLVASGNCLGAEEEVAPSAEQESNLVWHESYTEALDEAESEAKMLLVFFHETEENAAREAFEKQTLADAEIQKLLGSFVLCRVPVDAAIRIDGVETKLLDHAAFAEMQHRQGVAILDFAHWENEEVYGHVVSTFPFKPGTYYPVGALKVVLDLPVGTLTQRTMVYAVRMHPEGPRSTDGEFSSVLQNEAESHSIHQARIRLQGHHRWDFRFHRIARRLLGAPAQEVVAESWPGQDLVEACHDCVASWRQSSGHWQAVRSNHAAYGYDIKRGSNGIWYATGIFAGFRR